MGAARQSVRLGNSIIMRILPLLTSAAVLALLSWYYFIQRGFPVSWGFTNAVIAMSATVVLAMAFGLGAVARIHALRRLFRYRKDFGRLGYGLSALHVALAAWVVADAADPISYSDASSLVFAAMAFLIFTMMALTSSTSWVRALGYRNWKSLQRTGYLALASVFVHVALLEQGVMFTRTVGQLVLSFVLLVFLARGVAIVTDARRAQRRRARRAAREARAPLARPEDAIRLRPRQG